MRAVSVLPQLEQTLLAEFRQHRNAGTVVQIQPRRRYAVYAAAAALTLAFAAIAYQSIPATRSKQPVVVRPAGSNEPTKPQNESTQGTSSLPAAVSLEAPEPKPVLRALHQRTKPRKPNLINNSETVAANHATTEIVSEFIPIGYSTALNVEDGAQLLRIEMPRSAMVRFGLPVNMERYNERVKADVLVSADGLARAIRFVQ